MKVHVQNDLARRAIAGDLKARNDLLESLQGLHHKLIYELDTDRVLSDDLLGILAVRFLESFTDWKDSGASFTTFWYGRAKGIIKHALRDLRKGFGTDHNYSLRSRDAYLEEEAGWLEPPVEAPEPEVRDVTEGLDDRGRTVLRMYHVDGYTQSEIAEHFGVSRKTVNVWIKDYTEAVRSDPRNAEFLQ